MPVTFKKLCVFKSFFNLKVINVNWWEIWISNTRPLFKCNFQTGNRTLSKSQTIQWTHTSTISMNRSSNWILTVLRKKEIFTLTILHRWSQLNHFWHNWIIKLFIELFPNATTVTPMSVQMKQVDRMFHQIR